ncbi:MAG: 4a-hydroxytetrahydrobiopterin dehydratase [Candidatus Didemnitutus sp.]|nr:4a-hydroxytetrahydrobiopterin dehydratase [Candidatus Didemnitutus sp.]
MSKPPPLTPLELITALAGLPDWSHVDGALIREHEFPDFRDFIAFVTRASLIADAADHRPEWTAVRRKLQIRLTTHDAGCRVTHRDVSLAQSLDRLFTAGGK